MDRYQSTDLSSLVVTAEGFSPNKKLRRHEAAVYLKSVWGVERTKATLAKLSCLGGGPAFYKDGRIPLYAPADLDDWARSKIGPKLRSTSDKGVQHERR
jgi:hypothetical protein